MTKLVVLALLALARLARADCTTAEAAEAKRAAATAANEGRFADALKKLKLERVRLDASTVQEERASAGKVVAHAGASVLVLDLPELSCGGPPRAEFASDGKLGFRLERQGAGGKATRLDVCGCNGAPAGCGAVPRSVATGYVIPAGLHYGGVKLVEYVADSVNVKYGVDRQGPCPQAPARK